MTIARKKRWIEKESESLEARFGQAHRPEHEMIEMPKIVTVLHRMQKATEVGTTRLLLLLLLRRWFSRCTAKSC